MTRVIVIGGGAAGLMAAVSAAESGAKVILCERNECLGKKLSITGKGRCNLTNDCEAAEVIKNVPGNGSFLYSALHTFSPQDTMGFFRVLGVELKTERGRRVFPVSDDAKEIVKALTKRLNELSVQVFYNCRVSKILCSEGRVRGVFCGGQELESEAVILATGGQSYPGTGSTGDGYRLAALLGHKIITPHPALVPLETSEQWPKTLSGLALKNVQVTAYWGGKKLGSEFGEMLFTHFGVSGPLILTLSHTVCRALVKGQVKLSIDLKPALSAEQLRSRVQRDLDKHANKHFGNALGNLLPTSLIPVVVSLAEIPEHKPCHQITKEERERLVTLLKALSFTISGTRPLSEAIVTAGGICVKEVEPKTMRSKLVKGLYLAGEVLDVDGFTGGYNLQVAWSSGRVAGLAAAEENFKKSR